MYELWKSAALVAGIFLVLTIIPTAYAVTDTVAGTVDDYNNINGQIYASNLTASADGVLKSIGIDFHSTAASNNVVVGIYADNGTHGPGALLMSNVSLGCAGVNWCDYPIGNVTITAGTEYWLAFEPDSLVVVNTSTTGNKSKYVSQTYNGSLPANFGLTTDYSALVYLRMSYNISTNGPIWSGNATYNSTATYDPAALYGFQTTWTAASGLFNTTNITFVSNFTGTDVTYTNSTSPAIYNTTPTIFRINFTQSQFKTAGAYNYHWTATNGTGNSTDTWTFSIPQAAGGTVSLASSAGWNIAAYSTPTITCTASAGLPIVLTKDGISVANPYTAQFTAGIYNFTCQLADTANYTSASATQQLNVLSSGAGCWNATSYVYSATVAGLATSQNALNFTPLVASGLVKSDLSDVYVSTSNTSSSVQLNGTFKLFLVNSSNVTNFVISFGNGLANNSYTNVTATNQTLTPYSYVLSASYYYYVNILDEMNGLNMSMPMNNASLTLTLNCANGANTVAFNSSTFIIPTLQQLTSARVTATYTASSIYYRDQLVSVPAGFLNFYMLDAINYQVVQMLISLQDNSGQATSPSLLITKTIGGGTTTITNLLFDIEKKAVVYLGNGEVYQISVQSAPSTWSIGNLVVDNVNLVKTIVIGPNLATNQNAGNVSYSLGQSGSNIVLSYFDPANLTQWVNMSVYTSNGTFIAEYSAYNSNSVSFIHPMTENITYDAIVTIWNGWFGDYPYRAQQSFDNNLLSRPIDKDNPSSFFTNPVTMTIAQICAGLLIITLPMFFDQANASLGLIITCIAAIMLWTIHWWTGLVTVLILALVLAVFNKYTEKRTDV